MVLLKRVVCSDVGKSACSVLICSIFATLYLICSFVGRHGDSTVRNTLNGLNLDLMFDPKSLSPCGTSGLDLERLGAIACIQKRRKLVSRYQWSLLKLISSKILPNFAYF